MEGRDGRREMEGGEREICKIAPCCEKLQLFLQNLYVYMHIVNLHVVPAHQYRNWKIVEGREEAGRRSSLHSSELRRYFFPPKKKRILTTNSAT